MFKKIALLSLALLAIAMPVQVFADNYITIPSPTAVWDTSTGVLYAIGTPGNTAKTIVPSATTTNAWSALNNFTGTFQIGGVTQTFPTNGKIASANGPAPVGCGATCTVAAGNSLTLLNQAAGSVATLPAATATGDVHRFRISVLTTSGAEKILTNPTTDAIVGTAIGENASTAIVFVGNASTYHSIQMPFAGSQPSGGFIGDQITCTDIAAGKWACDINYQGGTTPTTPYSASTS